MFENDDSIEAVKADQARKRVVEDFKWLMAHRQGRRVMWGLLEKTGVHHNPWNNSDSVTAFNCGRMNVGQEYQGEIMDHCPEQYLLMLKERNE